MFVMLHAIGQERGMRARGLTMYGYKKQLKGWIDLSIQKHIPISLLIMSRAFVIHQALNPETVLRDSLSSLDEDIINEVVIEAAHGVEKDSLEIRRRRLESIEFQQEVSICRFILHAPYRSLKIALV